MLEAAQIILVNLESELNTIADLFDDIPVTLHVVDDLDEAIEMASVTSADIVLLNETLGGMDPVEVVARYYAELGMKDLVFIYLRPAEYHRARILRRDKRTGEFVVGAPGPGGLEAVLLSLVKSEVPPPITRMEGAALEQVLSEVGFNNKFDVDDRTFLVQTEVHNVDDGVVIRSTLYEGGRIVIARTIPVDLGEDPVETVKQLVEDIHQETGSKAFVLALDKK